jgi:Zn-dependent protease
MQLLLALLAIPLLIVVTVLGVTLFRLLSVRLRASWLTPAERSDIPEHARAALLEGELWARHKGFEFVSVIRSFLPFADSKDPQWGVVLHHPRLFTWVEIQVPLVQEPPFPWRATFVTPLDSGRTLATVSAIDHGVIPGDYRWQLADAWTTDIDAQWRLHLGRIKGQRARLLHPLEYVNFANTFHREYYEKLVAGGHYRPQGRHQRLALGAALRLTPRMIRGELRLAKLRGAVAKNAPAPAPEADLGGEVAAFHNLRAIREGGSVHWLIKTGLLLFSVLLFGLAFGMVFSWWTVLLLIPVLLLHEAGHLFGMWLFGYRNLQMLFVPMLGAVALGHKERVPLWQEVTVLLLGPVPGLLLGLALLTAIPWAPPWLLELALLLLILNLFNLLPVMPLDGGRIVNLALFDHLPQLHSLVHLLSLLAVGSAAILLEETVLMILAGLLALSLHAQMRENNLLSRLLREGAAELEGDEQVAAILGELRRSPLGAQPFAERFEVARSLVNRLAYHHTPRLHRAGALLAWAAAVVLPVVVVLGPALPVLAGFALWGPSSEEQLRATLPQVEDWPAYIEAAADDRERLTRLYQAAAVSSMDGDPEQADGYLEQADEIVKRMTAAGEWGDD